MSAPHARPRRFPVPRTASRAAAVSLLLHALAATALAAWGARGAAQVEPVPAAATREMAYADLAPVTSPADWPDRLGEGDYEPEIEDAPDPELREVETDASVEVELEELLRAAEPRAPREFPTEFASLEHAHHAPETEFAAAQEPVAVAAPVPELAVIAARPDYAANPVPSYPRLARVRGWEGTTLLSIEVDALGRPGAARVLASSGYDVLDRAALDAVARWTFVPARRGAVAVAATVEVPVTWRLER
jgi:protein TonB